MADLEPRRYILQPTEVSACFAHLNRVPPRSAFYNALPAAAVDLPARVFRNGRDMEPAARAIFEILANPATVVTVTHYLPEASLAFETRVLARRGAPHMAIVARPADGTWDLALVNNRAQALAMIDGLIGLGSVTSPRGRFAAKLSVTALAVLAAMADRMRDEELRSRLDRTPASFSSLADPVPVDAIVDAIRFGQERPDLRTAMTRVQMLSRGATAAITTPADIRKGLSELASSGLLRDDGSPSADGVALALALVNAKAIGGISAVHQSDAALVVDSLVYATLPDTVLVGDWDMDAQAVPRSLQIGEMSHANALAVIDSALQM